MKIKRGEFVFKFSERVIRIDHPPGCHCKVCCRCIQIGQFDWMYPYYGSYGYYLNHSCDPNCGIKGKNIISIKKIKRGEEITIDYSTTNTDGKWKMLCKCKEIHCRKMIRGVQFLLNDEFTIYKKIMPKYVAENYALLHSIRCYD